MKWLLVTAMLVGCTDKDITPPPDPIDDPDPLTIAPTAQPGSLDDLHERIVAKRCSGQPGLCHNGQFEPNLSTPALMYEYVVNRPGLEKPDHLRVAPGSAANSLLVDKLRNRGVATQMPLGAEPLDEADIQKLEAWIDGGALRRPGAAPAPVLNNPPKRPEVAVFDNANRRLDGAGPIKVNVGDTIVLRHSVQDFETADASIPFAAVLLGVDDTNFEVVLNPGDAQSPNVGPTTFDTNNPPLGKGDKLNFKRAFTITNPLPVRDKTSGALSTIDPHGKSFTALALYIDAPTMGIVAFDFGAAPIGVNP